jgi:hypothetical protein
MFDIDDEISSIFAINQKIKTALQKDEILDGKFYKSGITGKSSTLTVIDGKPVFAIDVSGSEPSRIRHICFVIRFTRNTIHMKLKYEYSAQGIENLLDKDWFTFKGARRNSEAGLFIIAMITEKMVK